MSFAGLSLLLISPPARAGYCNLAGGYMRKEQAVQPVEGAQAVVVITILGL
jgi:hypothetical protein